MKLAKENNPSAFPLLYDGGNSESFCHDGMTLRDYFATKAMAGVMASSDWRDIGIELKNGLTIPENIALHSYLMADAMLKQREV